MPENPEVESVQQFFGNQDLIEEYGEVSSKAGGAREFAGLPFHRCRTEQLAELALKFSGPGERVFEVGCGVAWIGLKLLLEGRKYAGIDISAEMIAKSRAVFDQGGDLEYELQTKSLACHQPTGQSQLAIANGVICYQRDQLEFLRLIREELVSGGMALVNHRNSLFNLFALNQGTLSFLETDLLAMVEEDLRHTILDKLEQKHPGLKTEKREVANQELFRSSENPLSVESLYAEAGFRVREIQYTYIHPFPVCVDVEVDPDEFAKLNRAYACDWRGAFLGSQFIVIAEREG